LSDELRHDLLDQLGEEDEKHEDTEELVLESLLGIGGFEEGEADEEALLSKSAWKGRSVRANIRQ
jgi:hypothetical protein